MSAPPPPLERPLQRLAAGEIPANVALMHLLAEAEEAEAARAALAAWQASQADPAVRARLAQAAALLQANPGAHALIRRVLARMDHRRELRPDQVLGTLAADYDHLVGLSPEAAVALYSLGDPALLQAATAEVVERMRAWGLLGADRDALEIGCGTGRFLSALAPELAGVVGVDVSPAMVEAARAATARLANVEVRQGDGRDLGGFATAGFDLVLAADSFPYLVQAGLAEAYLAEIARVLRPGGDLLILNYSYRGSVELDEADLLRTAPPLGLQPVRRPSPGFRYWDAASFTFRRSA
jgi:SAM-dependent methyltransferase